MNLKNKSLFFVCSLSLLTSSILYADVSGKTYLEVPVNGSELNSYGVKDVNELGVAGVKVTGQDSSGTVKTVLSASDGSYTLQGLSGKVRVEFSDWVSYLKESPSNTVNNSSVRFVNDGDTNVNFGLYDSMEYCSANPDIASSVMINGELNSNRNSLVLFSNSDSGIINTTTTGYAGTKIADDSEVGTVWGLTYDREQKVVYSAAFLKRHAAYNGEFRKYLEK